MKSSDVDLAPETPRERVPEPTDAPSLLVRLRAVGLRVLLARWGVVLLGLVAAYVVTGRAHWHFIRPYATPVSNDEGYISALALRMIHGHWLPYVDGVSQRGPVLYWLTAAVMRVGGIYSWTTLRWYAMVLGFLALALTFLLAAELFSPFAAVVAALFVTYFFTYELNPWDGLGFNGEIVAMEFVLLSSLALAVAQRRAGLRPWRGRLLLTAGALAALAGLSKQVTLLHLGPALAWILLGPQTGPATRRERVRDLARFLAGFALPYVLVVGLYAATGHLREFAYYYQRYGREIFMAPLNREYMRDKLREQVDKYFIGIAGVSAIAVFGLARAVRACMAPQGAGGSLRERLRREGHALFALAQLLAAAAGASFTWRFFPHYFVQVFPIAALVAGYAVAEVFEPLDESNLPGVVSGLLVVLGASVLLAVASSALHRNVRLRRETDRWYQEPQTDPIVRYVIEKTTPRDYVFVWGFRAETYVSAHRRPASRFVYTVYPSGVVPWFQATRDEEERRVVPGSRELLLRDLEATRPELVVDAGRSMNGRYMYNYPVLRNYLDRHYCFMRYVDGEPVYRRRHGEHCPPADY